MRWLTEIGASKIRKHSVEVMKFGMAKPIRVKCESNGLYLELSTAEEHGAKISVHFRLVGDRIWRDLLRQDDVVLPEFAIRDAHNRMMLVGRDWWESNASSFAVILYRKQSGNWVEQFQKSAKHELIEWPKLRLTKSGEIAPFGFISRAYPHHLNDCHATSALAYFDQWVVSGNRVRTVSQSLLSTAYNGLDNLIGKMKRGDESAVTRYAATKTIRQKLLSHVPTARKGDCTVEFPNRFCSID